MPQLDLYIWFSLILFSLFLFVYIYIITYIILLKLIKVFFYRNYYKNLIKLVIRQIFISIDLFENFYFMDLLVLIKKQINIYKYFIHLFVYKNVNIFNIFFCGNLKYNVLDYNLNYLVFKFCKYIYIIDYIMNINNFNKILIFYCCLFYYKILKFKNIELQNFFENKILINKFYINNLNFLILKNYFFKYNSKNIQKENITFKKYKSNFFYYKYDLYRKFYKI